MIGMLFYTIVSVIILIILICVALKFYNNYKKNKFPKS